MNSNMILEVKFLVRTSIEDAVEEAIQTCKRLSINVVGFEFNGVYVSVNKHSVIGNVITIYKNDLRILQEESRKLNKVNWLDKLIAFYTSVKH